MNLIYSVASFDFDAVNYFVEVGRVTAAVKKFSFSAVCQSPMFVGRSPFFYSIFLLLFVRHFLVSCFFIHFFFFIFHQSTRFGRLGRKLIRPKLIRDGGA